MPLRLSDLPPALRTQALAAADHAATQKPSRPRKRRALTAGVDAHCAACGHHVTSEAAIRRHQADTGHGRYELLAEVNPPDQATP